MKRYGESFLLYLYLYDLRKGALSIRAAELRYTLCPFYSAVYLRVRL